MKKISVLLLIAILAFTLFVGCGDDETAKADTPRDLLDQMIEASKTVNNAEFKADFDLEISGLEALGFAGPMGLEVTGKMKDEKNMQMALSVDTGQGMVIEGDIYLSEEKMLVYAPLLQMIMGTSYVEMNMTDLEKTAGLDMNAVDAEQMLAVLQRFEDETDYSFYDILVLDENMDSAEITVNDEKVDTTKLVMSLNLENAVDVIKAFMTFISDDAEARALFLPEYSDEEIATMLEEMNAPEAQAEIDAALEMLDITNFEIVMYLNKDSVTVKVEVAVDVTITADGEDMNIKMNGFFDTFNFDSVKTIEFPEVDPAEVLNLNDMM